ncbi:ImmA/IrrE family metallo-endopeptidase [Bacillus sp. MRMR6]|uniref:ImmA/IrrE family metallo-endopeptidase n=1 Tax=Bacillus sp. MRMR6 TaxID=1928617 RepID=UPI0009512D05|nr:hypothetical protein [Bacillus sp. MRMR6]OLS36761.1 hypothetical protein BTR25_17250 [Bacillus sp. MRMR6]
MTIYTVDVYVFFANNVNPGENMKRIKRDLYMANSAWNGCIQFTLKGIFFSKRNRIINADSIPATNVFKSKLIDDLIRAARYSNDYKTGIYIFYLNGDYFAEGRGKKVVGVSGTEMVDIKSSTDYEFFGRLLLTDMATGRYTLAHELGHILFKRYEARENTFIHSDPSGPYINPRSKRVDPAHNNNRKNLMFPISPSDNPVISLKQCQVAKQCKIVKIRMNDFEAVDYLNNLKYF